MSVNSKILSIIILTFIGLLIFSYITGNKIILGSFEGIEKRLVNKNLDRVVNALNEDLNNLSTFTRDWSGWDDTYEFIISRNNDYITSNLPDSTFTNSNLQIIVYLSSAKEVVFGREFDRNKGTQISLSKGFTDLLGTNPIFLKAMTGTSVAGLLRFPEGIMHIAAEPILTSEGKGPSRGVLIMARFLDKSYIDNLANRTRLSLAVSPIGLQELPSDFYDAKIRIDKNKRKYVTRVSQKIISGYTIIRDVIGKPVLMFRIDSSREIYNQGKSALNYQLLALIITALLFGIIMMFLINRSVIGRLSKLSSDVNTTRLQDGHRSKLLQYTGEDEISSLTKNINNMLRALYNSHDDMENQKEIAEHASLAKSKFLSSMSHELRTPMNAILGFSQILKMQAKDDRTKENINEILNAGNHLLELINQVLDLAKIESGIMNLSVDRHSLDDLLNDSLLTIRPIAHEKSIVIENNVDLPPDIKINVDKARFKQILLNLLSNAIKYNSENGKIIIDCLLNDENMLCLSITDTGKGLTSEQKTHIFKPFDRAGAENSNITGTGLGLVITKDLIEQMNGTIGFESEVGKGSRFWIQIPFS